MIFGEGNFKAPTVSKSMGAIFCAILIFSSQIVFADLASSKWKELCGSGFAAIGGEVISSELEPREVEISKTRFERMPRRGQLNEFSSAESVIARPERVNSTVQLERRNLEESLPRIESTPVEVPQLQRAPADVSSIERKPAPIKIEVEVAVQSGDSSPDLKPRFQRLERTRTTVPEISAVVERQPITVEQPELATPDLVNSKFERAELEEPKPELALAPTEIVIRRQPAPPAIIPEAVVVVPVAAKEADAGPKFQRLKREPAEPFDVGRVERTPVEVPSQPIDLPELALVRSEPTLFEQSVSPEQTRESNTTLVTERNEKGEGKSEEALVQTESTAAVQSERSNEGDKAKNEQGKPSGEVRAKEDPSSRPVRLLGATRQIFRDGLASLMRSLLPQPERTQSDVSQVQVDTRTSPKQEVLPRVEAEKSGMGQTGRGIGENEPIPGAIPRPEIVRPDESQASRSRRPAQTPKIIDETPAIARGGTAKFSPPSEIFDPSRSFVPPRFNFPKFGGSNISRQSTPSNSGGNRSPEKSSSTGLSNFGGGSPIGAGLTPTPKADVKPQFSFDSKNRIGSEGSNKKSAGANPGKPTAEQQSEKSFDDFEIADGLSLLQSSPITEPGRIAQPKIVSSQFANPRGPGRSPAKTTAAKTSTPAKISKAPAKTTPLSAAKSTPQVNVSGGVNVLPRIVPPSPFVNSASTPTSAVAQLSSAKPPAPGTAATVSVPRGSTLRKSGGSPVATTNIQITAKRTRPRFTVAATGVGTDGAELASSRSLSAAQNPDSGPNSGTVAFYNKDGVRTKQVQRSVRFHPYRVEVVTETLFDPQTKLATTRTVIETEFVDSTGQIRETTVVTTLDPSSGKAVAMTKSTVVKNQKGEVLSSNVEVTRFDPIVGAMVRRTKAKFAPVVASP